MDAYEHSMALCRYIRTPDCSPAEVERLWRQAFEAVLIAQRFTRRAIDWMWEELAVGCWKRLWPTDEEKERTAGEWLREFAGDVFYCSDRWSLDRLARCHWAWRRYMEAVG